MQSGEIWLIDSDEDDRFIVQEVFQELKVPNEVVFIRSGKEAITRLEAADVAPFIIISEIELPDMTGFELRHALLHSSSQKCRSVPFIFWCIQATEEQVTQAYNLSVHGFFLKEESMTALKNTFAGILRYWLCSKMPSKLGAGGSRMLV